MVIEEEEEEGEEGELHERRESPYLSAQFLVAVVPELASDACVLARSERDLRETQIGQLVSTLTE